LDRETPTLIGNGVYLLDAWKRGDFVRLKANPDYQFGEPAKTDTITLKWYRANEELRQAIRNHEIDIAWRDLLLTDAAQTASEIDTIVHELQPSTRMWYLVFNADPQYDNSSIKNI